MKKLAVVILNWNGKALLEQFLPTLLTTLPQYADLIIIDNDSSDDSLLFLKSQYPQLQLIALDKNHGFATGYNLGLQELDYEYFCLLNSDIEVTPQWIEPIVNHLDSHNDVAIVQPKILSYHQKTHFEYAGACGGFLDYLGYPFCRGRLFDVLEEDRGQYDTPMEIFWATGAALFVRAEVFKREHGFDDQFFAHMEEIYFCWRVKNSGHKIMVIPQSVVYHLGGGTLPKNNAFKTYLNFRNNLFLLLKNLPETALKKTLKRRFFLDYIAATLFFLKGNFKDVKAVFKARRDFKKSYHEMAAKRKNCSEKSYQQLYPRSIIMEFQLKRKRFFNGKSIVR